LSVNRGAVHAELAYAQGKMLNHSGWHGFLPRSVTPSDVDMFFDNRGRILYCEISRNYSDWVGLAASPRGKGQVLGYQNIIRRTKHLAVLCSHSVPTNRQIDTRNDIHSFQVMTPTENFALTRVVVGNGFWQKFISDWFDGSQRVFLQCINAVRQTGGL